MNAKSVMGAVVVWIGFSQLSPAHANGSNGALGSNDYTTRVVSSKPPDPWSVEVGAGVLVSNVRTSHEDGYTLAPIEFTLSRSFGAVYLDAFLGGVFQGSLEILVGGYHTVIVHGIESHLDGAKFGARYNFTTAHSRLVPFAENTVGFAFADSRGLTVNGQDRGLGQDFNFNFTISGGLRYDVNDRWFVRLAAVYSHYSNAGLSEPERRNRQIDGVGPVLTFGFRF